MYFAHVQVCYDSSFAVGMAEMDGTPEILGGLQKSLHREGHEHFLCRHHHHSWQRV
jgi:hypothetical protein